jgi:hypothetical protein
MLRKNLSIPGKSSWRLPGAVMVFLLLLAGLGVAADDSYRDRGGGPDHAEMLARGNGGLPGMAFVRPVLSGVLYRAGFRGGDKDRSGLSGEQRAALCEAGFSGARYVDFGTRTAFGETVCDAGSLDYRKSRSSDTRNLMQDIHSVIRNPDKGPILVHCMWGVHSSGAVSAMALVQFCAWSEEQAQKYWNDARNNAPCSGGCDEWIAAKFKNFRPDPALEISAAEQRAICPRPGG